MKKISLIIFLLMFTPVLATNTTTCTGTSCVNYNIYMNNTEDYEFIMSQNTKIILNTQINGTYLISLQNTTVTTKPWSIFNLTVIEANIFGENFKIKIPQNVEGRLKTDINNINNNPVLYSTIGFYVYYQNSWVKLPSMMSIGEGYIINHGQNEHVYILAGFSLINTGYDLNCLDCIYNINDTLNFTGATISLLYDFNEQSIGGNITINESKIGEHINLDDIKLSCPSCPACNCPTCPECKIDYSRLALASEKNNTWFESINFKNLDGYFNYVVGGIIGLTLLIIIIIMWRKKLWKKLKKPKEDLPQKEAGYLEPF